MSHIPNSTELPEQNEKKEEVPSRRSRNIWRRVMGKMRVAGLIKANPAPASPAPASPSLNPAPASPSPPLDADSMLLVNLINGDLDRMSEEAKALTKYNTQLTLELETLKDIFKGIRTGEGDEKQRKAWLNTFRKELMKVKLAIPSKYDVRAEKNKHDNKSIKKLQQRICGEESKEIPQLHNAHLFKTSVELKDFEVRYNELELRVKLCLLCFSIFPQGATVKKRLMLQWWVVEGFASTVEAADGYFKELMEKGFIQTVNNNSSPTVGSCRLHPFHRAALVTLAERANLFNFGKGGDPTQNFSGSFQACLMGEGLISYQDFKEYEHKVAYEDFKKRNKEYEGSYEDFKTMNKEDKDKGVHDPVKVIKDLTNELEKLHLLMNVEEHILEFINDWFGKMKNLNFLYLGRWKAEAIHHIEVEEPKFLEELKKMKHVKLLSLQGVSNIIALPQSIQQLTNLEVLDLRACSNLETIPDRIDHLKKLKHLDMSECYLLAHMPQALAQLTNLQVLKGFFVNEPSDSRNSCTLADLHKLSKLEKLCIYTDWEDFPGEDHVTALHNLEALTKLTITWGVGKKTEDQNSYKTGDKKSSKTGDKNGEKKAAKLPSKLKKLDLKCFPKEATPNWLKLNNLEGIELKKLYIRGGKFRDLGQYQGIDDEASESQKKWTVEVLRLKYLGEIEMEWRQLQGLFPKLKYLEKVGCPNLTLFPCDAKGVWKNTD
ncbi:disease resistance RPP13-like protein 4 [Salvia miltiorrhiza]|uniref:disease resistance RPP13-like protein 4 n=1 Tax=Salvia miltiorrhiza TaxID=226208 RepID=UPI0025AC98D8|nr:disease resistance RPP13-like protein 4 [Salvia miltiorrhiza]